MNWLQRLFSGRGSDEDRLMELEQRADAVESQATVAQKRAEGVLNADAARRAAHALRHKRSTDG